MRLPVALLEILDEDTIEEISGQDDPVEVALENFLALVAIHDIRIPTTECQAAFDQLREAVAADKQERIDFILEQHNDTSDDS